MSGASRSQSADTDDSVKAASSDDATVDGDEAPLDSTMKVDTDPSTPHTPDQPTELEHPTSSRVSRDVTINLRNTQPPLDTIPSSPVSLDSPTPASHSHSGEVKVSVEESEADVPMESQTVITPNSSSSDRDSPSVEVVDGEVLGEDLDMGGSQVTFLSGSLARDPSRDFPWNQAVDHYSDIMAKLSNYLCTGEQIRYPCSLYCQLT